MKEEAVARGVDVKEVSRLNKGELQQLLVIGSTCITKTDAWGEVLRLREKFQKDRQAAAELEQERQYQLYLKEEKEAQERHKKQLIEARERQKREQERKEKERAAELIAQVEKHTHYHPKVHGCKLAKTGELLKDGSPRMYGRLQCDACMRPIYNDLGYTCEACDYDICQDCFKEKTMTPEEKKAEAKRKAKEEKERREIEAERRRLEEEEEAQYRAKWDAKQQFKSSIINPPDKNLDPNGNKMKGFTVWCSDGYGNDGWHSYEGPPTKEFDATFKTKEEANNRARYLFHWKNPWGLGAEEIAENSGEIHKSVKNELVTYEVTPDDSSTWTVGVVPDAAYSHLDNASSRRHGYDGEYGSRESCEPGMGELFY